MSHEVFISYSHKDKNVADAICNHLENEGLRCWYAPRDIKPGEEWGNAIVNGIQAARIMVLVFTPDANLSQQVLREVNNAVSAGVTIIPFRLTEEEPTGGMRYYLSSVHWLDAMDSELEESIQKLTGLCKAVAEGSYDAGKQEERPAADTAAPKGKMKPVIIIAAIALLVLAGIAVFMLNTRGSGSGSGGTTDTRSTEQTSPKTGSYNEVMDIGATSQGIIDDPDCSYTTGNIQGNIQNGGYMTADESGYFYTSNDGEKLYHMDGDGKNVKKLADVPAKFINVYDGYVYFVSSEDGTYRMKTDGSGKKIISEELMWGLRIVNDRLYFGDNILYSTDLEGGDKRVEWEYLENEWCMDYYYLYYADPDRGGHLYRVDLRNKEEVCILDDDVFQLRIAGRYLYFCDDTKGLVQCRYDLTTGEVTKAFDGLLNSFTVTADGFYGYESENNRVAFVPFSGSMKILSDEAGEYVNVIADKLFYQSTDSGKFYIMDIDGSDRRES